MNDAPLSQKEAAAYIGMRVRWLDTAPIEWMDFRKPGALRAVKRWSREALDDFLESRLVQPGHASPFAP